MQWTCFGVRSLVRALICASLAFVLYGEAARAMKGQGPASIAVLHRNACANAARTTTISPDFGAAVGHSPVWAVGFFGPRATAGHQWKILWVIDGRFTQPVTINGWSVRDHTPLQIQLVGYGRATSAVLDPLHPLATPLIDPEQWANFPSGIYPSKDGCWVLHARWPGGSWRLRFLVD